VNKFPGEAKLTSKIESGGAILILLAATASAVPATAAMAATAPSGDEMARCASIQAPDSRLSCYDALAHRPPDKLSAAVVKAAPPAAPASSATVAAVAADPQNFGLTAVQQHTADLGPKSETAHISIVSSDQSGRTFVVLDSGQTWTVMDSDGRLSGGDAVTIKRAALGSFLMLTPSNHSYRVRRVK
jgi:hypothetical protein